MQVIRPTLQDNKRLDEFPVSGWAVPVLVALGQGEQACLACADACAKGDESEQLHGCIRVTLGCAAICSATATEILRRPEGPDAEMRTQLHACLRVCQLCADLCEKHSVHDPCRHCAEACRDCHYKCLRLLDEISERAELWLHQ